MQIPPQWGYIRGYLVRPRSGYPQETPMPLTDTAAKKAKPQDKPYKMADGVC